MTTALTARVIWKRGFAVEKPSTRTVVIGCIVGLAQAAQLLGFTLPNAKQATANETAQFHWSDEFKACTSERIQHNEDYHPPEHH